jgi:hypothetical protein
MEDDQDGPADFVCRKRHRKYHRASKAGNQKKRNLQTVRCPDPAIQHVNLLAGICAEKRRGQQDTEECARDHWQHAPTLAGQAQQGKKQQTDSERDTRGSHREHGRTKGESQQQ